MTGGPTQARRLFRSLLPSWKFFVDVAPKAELLHRVIDESGRVGEWRRTLEDISARSWMEAFLINPRGNLRLACQTAVDQLAEDIAEVDHGDGAEAITRSVCYAVVLRVVCSRVKASRLPVARGRVQFKIAWKGEDAFVSAEHESEERGA